MSPRKRTILSFSVLGFFIVLVVSSWLFANSRPEVKSRESPFRAMLEWNGKIWGKFSGRGTRAGGGKRPPDGKPVRVNGDVGIDLGLDLTQWKLNVIPDGDAATRRSIEITMAEIRSLPRTDTNTEFRCIEGWSDDVSYAGVRFSDFLKYYQLGAEQTKSWDPEHLPNDLFPYVALETPDGEYYVSIDMKSMLHPQTVLAYEMNGRPLERKNGAPLRLIIPVKYGIKSLKQIGKIYFSKKRPPDYWEEDGYDWFAGL